MTGELVTDPVSSGGRMTFRARIGIFVLSVALLSACQESFDEAGDRARLAEMRQEILDLAADPVCDDPADCRFIALGAKPCGGPWEYLVYSVASVDSVELAERVDVYNELNAELNLRYGWVSDCSVPPVPTLDCRDGRCVDLDALDAVGRER